MIYNNKNINIYKIILSICLLFYILFYLKTINEWHFIDNINLIFHEAGHIIFGLFGNFIGFLGGTLMQILIPIVLSFYFYKKGDNFSGSILLFWLSQNIFNIYVYLRDAVKMELPLIGGEHDWNFLLSNLNLLAYTEKIANMIYFLGLAVLVFAFFLSIKFSINIKNQNV